MTLPEALKYAENLLRETVKDADTRTWCVSHCSSDLISGSRMNKIDVHLSVSPPPKMMPRMQPQADEPLTVEGK
jgi:hypothetical protein